MDAGEVSSVDDLVAFLNARLDEREARAQAAIEAAHTGFETSEATAATWTADSRGFVYAGTAATIEPHAPALEGRSDDERARLAGILAEHIALHDPASVLADVESKRRILALHADSDFPANEDDGPGAFAWTAKCDGCYEDEPCTTKRLLALPFASHPDYREEFRP